jgi:hypothetical protein
MEAVPRALTGWAGARLALIAALVALAATPAAATSIKQFRLAELGDHASLIIEGQVIAAVAREDGLGGGIGTYVRIRIIDRLKGPDVGPEVELRFAGGTVGDQTLQLADMVIPKSGETGVYFVESLDAYQLNPLVGWSQGHFVEMTDPQTGLRGMYTPDRRAILGIGSAGVQQQQVMSGSHGTALEIQAATKSGQSPRAMNSTVFKRFIRKVLASRGGGTSE